MFLFCLAAAFTQQSAITGVKLAPTERECRAIDPLAWCVLRVHDGLATLEHERTCADLALVDALNMMVDGYEVAKPLRESIWRGFEDHVCLLRGGELVIESKE